MKKKRFQAGPEYPKIGFPLTIHHYVDAVSYVTGLKDNTYYQAAILNDIEQHKLHEMKNLYLKSAQFY